MATHPGPELPFVVVQTGNPDGKEYFIGSYANGADADKAAQKTAEDCGVCTVFQAVRTFERVSSVQTTWTARS